MFGSAGVLDWGVFAALLLLTTFLQALLFGRSAHRISFREASLRTVLWVLLGVGFTSWIHHRMGPDKALSYFIAYVVEESLSVDNLFVFLVIFSYFGIGERHQQRVLTWGIIGAMLMRGLFIFAGVALLQRFHFLAYLFGAILIVTGIKLGLKKEGEAVDPSKNFALRLAKRYLRTTDQFEGERFFTVRNGQRYATPLLLVLIVVEFTDVVFAVDSVPAVLAISDDFYIVFTSNMMAILGLRALYFMLAGMMSRFKYLDVGLAVILTFIGVKMIAATAEWFKVPNLVSLGVIAGVLTISIVISLFRSKGLPSNSEND